MDKTNEMFVQSKYKYIRHIVTGAIKPMMSNFTNKIMTEKDIQKALKEEKKKKMAEMCKKKDNNEKVVYVVKEKYVNTTPWGEKKDTSGEMPSKYDPAYVESAWDEWWTKKEFFKVSLEQALKVPRDKRFIMLLPPPNVTG